ncbi:MAG TPA: hypothetical protein VF729_07065 [Solirubrobacterales bacterium]
MDDRAAETTQDWQLPDSARPPLIGELVERIDEALATARASEAAVMTVGAAALDAAEQARRAADLAERASSAMLAGQRPVGLGAGDGSGDARRAPSPAGNADDGLRDFAARADRVAARLRELERTPIAQAVSR